MGKAPIILFVYNRLGHTIKAINSLLRSPEIYDSILYIFSDGPKSDADGHKVNEVRAYLKRVKGPSSLEIIERPFNQGLAASVIAGVTDVLSKHHRAIVIEDDLEFSQHFLSYMNMALRLLIRNQTVFSIGGYTPRINIPSSYPYSSFLSYRCCTWGWATWEDRWLSADWSIRDYENFTSNPELVKRFNLAGEDVSKILRAQMEGKIDSWGIRWDYAHFKNRAYCLRPLYSLTRSTGNDGSGTHCGITQKYDVDLDTRKIDRLKGWDALSVDTELNNNFAMFYDGRSRS